MRNPELSLFVLLSQGRVVSADQGLKELLNIPNSARVINLKFPRPGFWKLKVFSLGKSG